MIYRNLFQPEKIAGADIRDNRVCRSQIGKKAFGRADEALI